VFSNEAPHVRQEIVFIEDLLQEIALGRLRVPDFQRPYVWKPSDMLDLFDSIKKSYPIGSLLFWESGETVESVDEVGPIQVPRPSDKPLTYILDGHQRMATLFGCLRLPKDAPRGPKQNDWRWWVWFDLEDEEFTHLLKDEPPPTWIPLRSILRTVNFLEEARRIQDRTGPDAEAYIKKAETLAQIFKNYKVSVTRINGGSLSQAVEIFSRLNTKGRSMTLDQMVSALTYREGQSKFNLARRIDSILASLAECHFGNIRRITVFRAIVAAANKDIYNSDWETVSKELGADLDHTVDCVERALFNAARFLTDRLGVPSGGVLPYTNQLLLIGEFFRLCITPSESQQDLLERWFWVTSFSGWFAGANTTQIRIAITEMHKLAEGISEPFEVVSLDDQAQPFPMYFDMRSARVRCLLLVMLRLRPRDPRTGEVVPFQQVLREIGSESLARVFRNAGKYYISNPANRVILDRNPGVSVRDRFRSSPDGVRDAVLESHGISEGAFAAFMNDDPDDFVGLRARTLAQIEREFMQVKGIRLPDELTTDEIVVDTDVYDVSE
jgi:Protein of unknown function DUF262